VKPGFKLTSKDHGSERESSTLTTRPGASPGRFRLHVGKSREIIIFGSLLIVFLGATQSLIKIA